jgi:hypothetical protein
LHRNNSARNQHAHDEQVGSKKPSTDKPIGVGKWRMPGTHNTKDGSWRKVEIDELHAERRYELDDLEDALATPALGRDVGQERFESAMLAEHHGGLVEDARQLGGDDDSNVTLGEAPSHHSPVRGFYL